MKIIVQDCIKTEEWLQENMNRKMPALMIAGMVKGYYFKKRSYKIDSHLMAAV